MRQLVRVVVATAALLGVLGLPTPVAAETAEQCQATLNAYRAKATWSPLACPTWACSAPT